MPHGRQKMAREFTLEFCSSKYPYKWSIALVRSFLTDEFNWFEFVGCDWQMAMSYMPTNSKEK